jgi:hypothetical protein
MWLLWLGGGWLALVTLSSFWEKVSGTARMSAELANIRKTWASTEGELQSQGQLLDRDRETLSNAQSAFELMRAQRTSGFPWLAEAFGDYAQLVESQRAAALETKSHPARKAAEEIREAGRKLRAAERLSRIRGYQLEYYESLFPWLTDFKDLTEEDAETLGTVGNSAPEQDEDAARRWLSEQEYASLSSVDKYQRALDRYHESRKTPWQVGRDYERYVGFLMEKDGYKVEYRGALDGLADMGRDLIAARSGEIHIIQCKRWAASKQIHEKHVFQLFGSSLEYQLALEDAQTAPLLGAALETRSTIVPVLFASTFLSPMAVRVAKRLNVRYIENFQPRPYPLIKCNISFRTGEKIYHLPFDQQYDRVVITPSRGEVFAMTVAEAERAGFRRAFRWKGPLA